MERRTPAELAGTLVAGLAGLLETPSGERIAALVPLSDAGGWTILQRAITMHGLAPHLFRSVPAAELLAALGQPAHDWLAEQDALNGRRIERMHAELAAILRAAADQDIEVMPLKGALLTTMPGTDPHRRPMADLDLLIRPEERRAMGGVLEGLGYRQRPEANPSPTHDVYLDAGGGRVVSVDEHPDNPRPVEVHLEAMRHLWPWIDDDDLTPVLWSGSRRGTILGQPATVPDDSALLAHLAIHATADLLVGRGRLVHWLDLGQIAARGVAPGDAPHARLAYPALRLARRALPRIMAGVAIDELEANVPRRLARWASTVPLDRRCGLMVDRQPATPSSLAARVDRWAPVPWRLLVAYGDRPRPLALALYAKLLVGRWRARRRYRALHPQGG
jgi:hypothetical protein